MTVVEPSAHVKEQPHLRKLPQPSFPIPIPIPHISIFLSTYAFSKPLKQTQLIKTEEEEGEEEEEEEGEEEEEEEEMRNPTSATTTENKISKAGLKRGPWTPEEDQLLSSCIAREGDGRWRTLPKRAGLLRCGKSCRLRWMNYLRPTVKRGHIAPDEEDLILRLHRLLGNRWSLIAGRIPGRTDNEIKNYWNTHLSKKLISQGIDPRTHKPLNPNPNSAPQPPVPAPAPNPNLSSSSLEEFGGAAGDLNGTNNIVDANCGNRYMEGPNQIGSGGVHDYWQNSDGMTMTMMMGFQDSRRNLNNDDDVDCCSDDVFSSFFNSLIDEDVILKLEQEQQQQQHQSVRATSDSPLPSVAGVADRNIDEVPSPVGLEGEQSSQFADHGGKCL